jgi:MFS superfamily sulfate permease-like transporter
MRGFEVIAIVIAVFFIVGIVVGMLLVIALPVLRSVRRERRNRRLYGGNWWKLPAGADDDGRRPPRWPGT